MGEHPDGGAIAIMDGKYGPYVKWEKINATLPKESDPETVTLEQAVDLVNEKAAQKGVKRKKKPAAKKKTAAKKKAAPKKKAS